MTTKDQERTALSKIRKIVEELGENSYIGMAMDGVWEIAEENIENDFALSLKDMVDARDRANVELRDRIEGLKTDVKDAETNAKLYEDRLMEETKRNESLAEMYNKTYEQLSNAQAENNKLLNEIAKMKEDIVHLKAECYDLNKLVRKERN